MTAATMPLAYPLQVTSLPPAYGLATRTTRSRTRPVSSVIAAVVLALFGGALIAVAVGLPLVTAVGGPGHPGDLGTARVLVAIAPILVVGGAVEIVTAGGLIARRRWAASVAEIAAIIGVAAVAGCAFALVTGFDPFSPASDEPALGSVKNGLSLLLVVALGYWVVIAGARRAARAAEAA